MYQIETKNIIDNVGSRQYHGYHGYHEYQDYQLQDKYKSVILDDFTYHYSSMFEKDEFMHDMYNTEYLLIDIYMCNINNDIVKLILYYIYISGITNKVYDYEYNMIKNVSSYYKIRLNKDNRTNGDILPL